MFWQKIKKCIFLKTHVIICFCLFLHFNVRENNKNKYFLPLLTICNDSFLYLYAFAKQGIYWDATLSLFSFLSFSFWVCVITLSDFTVHSFYPIVFKLRHMTDLMPESTACVFEEGSWSESLTGQVT